MAINKNELNQYQKFVDKVTSDASKNTEKLVDRLEYVDRKNIHVSRILTAGIGLSGEVGEFNEIIKKALFQEKELDDQTVTHLKKELGDIMWYIAQACISLNSDIEEIIDTSKHYIITSVHPSPLSAHRGFFGSNPFSKTNKFLKSKGIKPINWILNK